MNAADTGYIGSEIVTGGSVTNNSSTVLSQYFSTLSLSDDGTDLLLNITHNFTSLATTPNGVAFATALDASINSPNPQIQDLIGALDNSNLAYVQAALNGLSPDATFATTKALVSENYRMDSLVQDHLALTRNGGSTIMESPATKDSKGGSNPAQYSSSGMSRGNVWGNVSYSWQDIDNNFDGEEASFSAGVDYRISRNFLIGLLLDGSNADNNYTGGSSEVDSLRAAIYGTYGQSTGIYVDFLAGYGAHDFRLSDTGGILGGSNSDTDAESLQAMLTFGYAMQAGNVKHGPFVGLEYQNVNVNSYTQSGLIPIAVDGYNVDSLRLLAGYRVEASYGRFAPYASVAYAHEFRDDAISTSATLPGGATFGVNGSGLGSSILISVGANYALTDNLTLTGGYLGAICVESDGVDSHGASLGLNWAF